MLVQCSGEMAQWDCVASLVKQDIFTIYFYIFYQNIHISNIVKINERSGLRLDRLHEEYVGDWAAERSLEPFVGELDWSKSLDSF